MLKRLFSETNLLYKNINFEKGINIILGKYSKDKDARGINGIGKSSTIRLINYLLLSDTEENRLSNEKYDFLRKENHSISLEINIKENIFIIKRYFKNKDEVYFGKDPKNLQIYTKEELKQILFNKFFPVEKKDIIVEGNRFGTLMHFFIKDDIDHHQRVEPLDFLTYSPSKKEQAIYNFYLLNLPTKNLIEFKQLSIQYEKCDNTIKTLKDKILSETGKSIQEFKTERIKLQNNIDLLEENLKNYEFLDSYRNVEGKLIELTTQINNKLKEYHILNRKLKKVKESFQPYEQEIDTEKIKNFYNELLTTFGDFVKKSFDEVRDFKNNILENRAKFILKKETELQRTIDQILTDISKLELERSKLYKILDEQGALESIKNTYEQLIIEKTTLEGHSQILRQIEEIQEILSNLNVTISELKREIVQDVNRNDALLNNLRTLFQKILKNIIYLDEEFSNAYFDVSTKVSTSRKSLPFKIDIEIPKGDALGQKMLKLIAYDLMIFLNNIEEKRELPKFLIHDGVFHGIAPDTRVNTLNFMHHQYLQNPSFQYILTFNEDEIDLSSKDETFGRFSFDWREFIVVEYEDIPEKMIFKRAFT